MKLRAWWEGLLLRWGSLVPAVLAVSTLCIVLELTLPKERVWLLPIGILQLPLFGWALFHVLRLMIRKRAALRQLAVEAACLLLALLFAQAKVRALVEVAMEPATPSWVATPNALYTGGMIFTLLLAAVVRRRPVRLLAAILVANTARMAVLSFVALIAVGTLLLLLPASVRDITSVSLLDALFTATTSVCVTGLVVNDIATTYTRFGHVVILLLIQLGGLGIMTLGTTAATVASRGLRVRQAATMAEVLDADSLSSVRRMVQEIVIVTLLVEASGAVALYWQFRTDPQAAESAVFHAVFHAVSAFCNAGISTLPQGLNPYVSAPFVPLVICGLIILGGLGFPVFDDIIRSSWSRWVRKRRVHLRLHTRLAVATSAILLLVGTVGYLILESRASMSGLGVGSHVLGAFFTSVSSRTAGFNLLDCAKMAPATLFFTMVLMFIGASPASTGGGVKTTTLAVFFAALRSQLRGRARVEIGNRTLPEAVIVRALVVAAGSAVIVGAAAFLLMAVDDHDPLKLLFEATSAFGTVGLSAGLTPSLSIPAKLIIIVVMLVGRVGPLTAALTLGEPRVRQPIHHPEERVLIG